MIVKEYYEYYPKEINNTCCKLCGIMSFAHVHREGTVPKDFEMKDETAVEKVENKALSPEKVRILEDRNHDPSMTEPHWKERLRRDYKGILWQQTIENSITYWDNFWEIELEESYFRGKAEGMTQEAVGCVEHCKKEYERGKADMLEGMIGQVSKYKRLCCLEDCGAFCHCSCHPINTTVKDFLSTLEALKK